MVTAISMPSVLAPSALRGSSESVGVRKTPSADSVFAAKASQVGQSARSENGVVLRVPGTSTDKVSAERIIDWLAEDLEVRGAPANATLSNQGEKRAAAFISSMLSGLSSDVMIGLIVELKAAQLEQSKGDRVLGGKLAEMSWDASKSEAKSLVDQGSAAVSFAVGSGLVGLGVSVGGAAQTIRGHRMESKSTKLTQDPMQQDRRLFATLDAKVSTATHLNPVDKGTLSLHSKLKADIAAANVAHTEVLNQAGIIKAQGQVISGLSAPVSGTLSAGGETFQKQESAKQTMDRSSADVTNRSSQNAKEDGDTARTMKDQLRDIMQKYLQSQLDAAGAVASKM